MFFYVEVIIIKKSIHNRLKNFVPGVTIVKKFIDNTKCHLEKNKQNNRLLHVDKIDKYKLIQRLILLFNILICYDIHKFTKMMYKTTGEVDMQWVIYATAYTAMLTLFVTFYTTSRTKEIDNEHKRDLQERWLDMNNNGINDYEEDWFIEQMKNMKTNAEHEEFEDEIIDDITDINHSEEK